MSPAPGKARAATPRARWPGSRPSGRRGRSGAGVSLRDRRGRFGRGAGLHLACNARPQPGTAPIGHPDGLVFAPQAGTVGLGYWVLERARRRGLASRAVALLTRWALAEAGMARIEALVEPENLASLRVVEKAGFVREGRLRAYLGPESDGRRDDVFVYSLLRTIQPGSDPERRPLRGCDDFGVGSDPGREAGPGPAVRGQAPDGGGGSHTHRVEGYETPVEAAMKSMPAAITHVVEVDVKPGGVQAYVLLAVEVSSAGFYLDENMCERAEDGSWVPSSGAGGGFTRRSLADLRAHPPRQGLA